MKTRKTINKGAKKTKTNSLTEIQKSFFVAISNPLTKKYKSHKKLKNGTLMSKVANNLIAPNDELTSFERLEIYNRQYWFRLINCLSEDFPGLRAIVGEKRFYKLVDAYLKKYPSRSYTLRNLGSRMHEFLKKNKTFAGSKIKIALEMAQFERSQIEAFDGLGLDLLDLSKLQNKNPSKLKLNLQPYISFFEFSYGIDEFVLALRKEQVHRTEAGSETLEKKVGIQVPLPKKQKVFLAVHRFENRLYYKRLDKPSYVLLTELRKGTPLGNACDKAFKFLSKEQKESGQAPNLIFEWFNEWSSLHWFCVASSRRY